MKNQKSRSRFLEALLSSETRMKTIYGTARAGLLTRSKVVLTSEISHILLDYLGFTKEKSKQKMLVSLFVCCPERLVKQ